MLPVGTPLGIPAETPAAPIVGNGALGSMVHPPAVEDGQAGGDVVTVTA
jgi:hypothetical protein